MGNDDDLAGLHHQWELEQQEANMNADDIYTQNNNLLKADDLQGRTHKLVISDTAVVKFKEGAKISLKFQGKMKALALNKTNYAIVKKAYGKETNNWIGKEIELSPGETMMEGRLVGCINVRTEQPKPIDDFNDDIPF